MTAEMKAKAYADYGAAKQPKICCEVDHLIAREDGGADDQANLWPQPWHQARLKDQVETWLHQKICNRETSLEDAQRRLATNWYELYLEMEQERQGK